MPQGLITNNQFSIFNTQSPSGLAFPGIYYWTLKIGYWLSGIGPHSAGRDASYHSVAIREGLALASCRHPVGSSRAKGPALYQPGPPAQFPCKQFKRAESPSHHSIPRASRWDGPSALKLPFDAFPGALPQAGMLPGLWPSPRRQDAGAPRVGSLPAQDVVLVKTAVDRHAVLVLVLDLAVWTEGPHHHRDVDLRVQP